MVVFLCFGLDFAPEPELGWVSPSRFRGGFRSLISAISESPVISDGIEGLSAAKESILELWVEDRSCERYPRRPLALARKVTTRFLVLVVLVKPTSLAELAVPSNAAVVGVRNDVLLRFCFGPEAAGVAALSFRFGGMGGRLWRC